MSFEDFVSVTLASPATRDGRSHVGEGGAFVHRFECGDEMCLLLYWGTVCALEWGEDLSFLPSLYEALSVVNYHAAMNK